MQRSRCHMLCYTCKCVGNLLISWCISGTYSPDQIWPIWYSYASNNIVHRITGAINKPVYYHRDRADQRPVFVHCYLLRNYSPFFTYTFRVINDSRLYIEKRSIAHLHKYLFISKRCIGDKIFFAHCHCNNVLNSKPPASARLRSFYKKQTQQRITPLERVIRSHN